MKRTRTRLAESCRIEPLEARYAPSNITVFVAGHTLMITGDADANAFTIDGTVGDATKFKVTANSGTLNQLGNPFTTPSGITDIRVNLLGGSDSVTFSDAVAQISLKGSVTINGGNGDNTVTATNLTVGKNLSITNGLGNDTNTLRYFHIGGSLTIKNGDGGSFTDTSNSIANTVGGNVTVTNGRGYDGTVLAGVSVKRNVTVSNGLGDGAGNAGYFLIYNQLPFRDVIGGNVTITFLDEVVGGSGIFDTEIGGNVALNLGTGGGTLNFDNYTSSQPAVIRGSLAIKTTGQLDLSVGKQYGQFGLIVGKNFTVTSTSTAADKVTLNKLSVLGTTTLALGDGDNTITIDDSAFSGAFTSTTGKGADTLKLETTAGSTFGTSFGGRVTINEGAGDDTLLRTGAAPDGQQFLYYFDTVIIHTGGNTNDTTTANNEIFLYIKAPLIVP